MLQAYELHPEIKSAAPDGTQANQRTVGLLGRLHVHELERVHIGKESNRLEDVDAGDVHDLDEVLTTFDGPGTDTFTLWVLPTLRRMSANAIAEHSGVSVSYAHRIKSGRAAIPKSTVSRKRLARAAADFFGLQPPSGTSFVEVCRLIARAITTGPK